MKIIDNSTVQVEADYSESTSNADATHTALADLAYSSVYYQPAGASAPVMGVKTPATSLHGGGAIKATLIIPAPVGVATSVAFWATETDTAGNEGPATAHVTFVVDRVAPDFPANFSIA